MGPIWGRQDPVGPHIGPMDFAIWENSPQFIATSSMTAVNSFHYKISLKVFSELFSPIFGTTMTS